MPTSEQYSRHDASYNNIPQESSHGKKVTPSHIGSSLHNVAYHSQRQIYCYQYLITSIIATSITELQIILLSDLYT